MPELPAPRRATLGGTPSREVLHVLGDATRYTIYLELARSARPLVTAEIAETLGLHPNTVRPHLDRMREVGIVEVTTDARGEVGRPQHRYSLAPDAPSLGLEPPTLPVLARMLLQMAHRAGARADDAVAVGESEGAVRAGRYQASPSTLEAVEVGDDGDSAVITFANCPFAAYAATSPELVCSLHRGLVSGFVDAMGDADVVEFCDLAHRTPCRVTLT